jgi:hypothetical protein
MVLNLFAFEEGFRRGKCRDQVSTSYPWIGRSCIIVRALGCSILIDFSIVGYFCQLEFIHSSDIAIYRID